MTIRAVFTRIAQRLKPMALNLALVGFSLTIAVVFAEVAVRVAAPQQLIMIRPDLWQPADTVGWLHRPNVSTTINTGERTVSIHTDGEGFRAAPTGRVNAEREVLLLGDSFMEALQVEYEDSGAGLLETGLAATLGEPIAVRNAGIGGWDPDQYLLRARSLLTDGRFGLVVTAVYLGNDVIDNAREYVPPRAPVRRYRFRVPRSLSGGELTVAILRPLNDLLEVRSHLFLLFKNRLQTLRMRLGLAVLTFPPQFIVSEDESPRWEVTAGLLEQIDHLATEQGAETLFVLIPAPFQIDPDDLVSYVAGYQIDPETIDVDQPNRRLGEALEARGLRTVDLLPAFRAEHDAGTRLYGSVDQHFTPEGNRLFADLVTPVIADLLESGTIEEEPAER